MRGKRQYGYGEIDYPPSIRLEKVIQEAKIKVNRFLYFCNLSIMNGHFFVRVRGSELIDIVAVT